MTGTCNTTKAVEETDVWPVLCRLSKQLDRIKSETPLCTDSSKVPFCWANPSAPRSWTTCSDVILSSAAIDMLDLYMPLLVGAHSTALVVAHLGQSLDGRIATTSGNSQFITGPENLLHTHRMRALFDAVVVGARTATSDNPRLTTRLASGDDPTRIVIDPRCNLDPSSSLFSEGSAMALTVCQQGMAPKGSTRHVEIASESGLLPPAAILAALKNRGLRRIFIEGGGITTSRFLQAKLLDRLHVCVAPMILGSGRPAFAMDEIESLDQGIFLNAKHFSSGKDMLFDCQLCDRDA